MADTKRKAWEHAKYVPCLSHPWVILSSINTFQQDELKRPEKEEKEKGFISVVSFQHFAF